jgi:8-oxo-dGTP pyrophosphatase MutT (NUDIX family)
MGAEASVKFVRPSRHPKGRQQVAAVCYRAGKRGIEFLLVQARSGRWIFPKGGVEPGLTHAQSAALEAFEEAGVHGRMEAIPFARYFRRKRDPASARGKRLAARSADPELAVAAHLCEVSRLEPPQESNRNPTWFSARRAKQRLLQDRVPELARVVDRAAARIRRLHGDSSHLLGHTELGYAKLGYSKKDALQQVRFEAFELAHLQGLMWSASYARYIRRERPAVQPSVSRSAQPDISVDARLSKILRSGRPLESNRPTLRLGNGAASSPETLQKVQFIDEVGWTGKAPAKSAKKRRE